MERPAALAQLSDHVVICNCNGQVRGIVEQLHAAQAAREEPFDIVLLAQDRALWEGHPAWHPRTKGPGRFLTFPGSPSRAEHLAAVRIHKARAAIILADPHQGALADARSALVAMAIERHAPEVHTVMELLLSVNRGHLDATEVNEVVCTGDIAEKLLAQSCVTPGSSRLFAHLLSSEEHTCQLFLRPVPASFVGWTYRSVAREAIELGASFTVCGYVLVGAGTGQPDGSSSRRIVLNPRADEEPGKDTPLGAGDELIVLARDARALERFVGQEADAVPTPA